MGIEIIGKQIAAMRKKNGIKQEELANFVGVSTQAVSKWENGGVPDTELLPKIAEFFSVSIDSLFGKNVVEYEDLQKALFQNIMDTPKELSYKAAFGSCWDIERALFSCMCPELLDCIPEEGDDIIDYEKSLGASEQHYSSVLSDYGFTRIGIANRLQYFLLVPEIENTDAAFFDGVDYTSFFKDFSDRAVFDSCVFLSKRDSKKAFTEGLLTREVKIDESKAKQVICVLEKYKLIYETQIEIDDDVQIVYHFTPSPSLIAILIFAREMIDPPCYFSYQSGGRNKPYLK